MVKWCRECGSLNHETCRPFKDQRAALAEMLHRSLGLRDETDIIIAADNARLIYTLLTDKNEAGGD